MLSHVLAFSLKNRVLVLLVAAAVCVAGLYQLARTPVDELEVREHPRVIFRVDEVTWIDAIVRYLVAPREAGPIKSRLIPKLLAALNAAPEKVMFPKGDAR